MRRSSGTFTWPQVGTLDWAWTGPQLETFRKNFLDLERTVAEGRAPADPSDPADLGWLPFSGGLAALLGIGWLVARRRAGSR
jgi:hypothetical protein